VHCRGYSRESVEKDISYSSLLRAFDLNSWKKSHKREEDIIVDGKRINDNKKNK